MIQPKWLDPVTCIECKKKLTKEGEVNELVKIQNGNGTVLT